MLTRSRTDLTFLLRLLKRTSLPLALALLLCSPILLAENPQRDTEQKPKLKVVEDANQEADAVDIEDLKSVWNEKESSEFKPPKELPSNFPIDVTDLVELELRGKIRATREGGYFVGIRLRNASDLEIPGPLYLVVESTGIAGLTARFSQEDEAKTSTIKFLPPAGTLKPNALSLGKRLDFVSNGELNLKDLDELKLEWKALRKLDEKQQPQAGEKGLAGKSYSAEELKRAMRVQERWTEQIMQAQEVVGTAISENRDGELVIQVLSTLPGIARELPRELEGIPVVVKATAPIMAGPAPPQGRADAPLVPEAENGTPQAGPGGNPRERFERPIPIGVSTSNVRDVCLSGTLGFAAIGNEDGQLRIVSNHHVWARGGNAEPGEGVLQPSRGDSGCSRNQDNVIGRFEDLEEILFDGSLNILDASVAIADAGEIAACTPDDGYGFPNPEPIEPVIGMLVQKYGRTTGLTEGRIFAINAFIRVNYGGGNLAIFRNQIGVTDLDDDFSRGGDSGSLIVSQEGNHPVALLYAGGGTSTFGNPINAVLQRFDIRVAGENTDPGEEQEDPSNASIGNFVWSDTSQDGIQDDDERGVPGIRVELFEAGDDDTVNNSDDSKRSETTTDASGNYSFENLPAGRYFLRFHSIDGAEFTQQAAGDDEGLDSNVDPETGFTGIIDLAESETNNSVDAGMIPSEDPRNAIVGNRVWYDFITNGNQDFFERWGFRNLGVMLVDAGPDGQAGTSDDQVVATRRTSSRGFYNFRNLPAGDYFVQFQRPRSRFRFTTPNVDRAGENRDSDADPQTERTEVFRLNPSEVKLNIDAGLRR